MKKILLSLLSVTVVAVSVNSQIICRVLEPAAIVGNQPFTWADTWGGTPNFNLPGTFVQDTLVIAEDGTPGNSATTIVHPLSQEGCALFSNAAAVAGKIAVVYRGTCNFTLKAANAQAAGAVGIIIINRDPDPIPMGGSDPAVTIPAVMIGSGPGQTITNTMATQTVVGFLGNKVGLLANDLTIDMPTSLIPSHYGVLSQLAQDSSEFNFAVGTRIFNFGNAVQTGVTVNAKVKNPSGIVVYDESFSGLTIPSNDSVDVFTDDINSLPNFGINSYPAGEYTLTYTVTSDSIDQSDEDNVVEAKFLVNDEVFSYSSLDPSTKLPIKTSGTRSADYTSTYSGCTFIQHPNASRIGVQGIYFSTTTDRKAPANTIIDQTVTVSVIKWDDALDSLNTAGSFTNITYTTYSDYTYTGDFQDSMVYAPLEIPVLLTDNDKYLVCAQITNDSTFLATDATVDYSLNQDYYRLPIIVSEVDDIFNQVAFGAETIFSIGVKVFDAAELSVEKTNTLIANAFPNPVNDKVSIRLNTEGNVNVHVTDLTGKTVYNSPVSIVNGEATLNTSAYEAGMYIVNITTTSGVSTKINIVKK